MKMKLPTINRYRDFYERIRHDRRFAQYIQQFAEQQIHNAEAIPYMKKASTKALADELETREDVRAIYVDPYDTKTIHINGPAVVYVIGD